MNTLTMFLPRRLLNNKIIMCENRYIYMYVYKLTIYGKTKLVYYLIRSSNLCYLLISTTLPYFTITYIISLIDNIHEQLKEEERINVILLNSHLISSRIQHNRKRTITECQYCVQSKFKKKNWTQSNSDSLKANK